jgi:hypothetical protein
MWIFNKLQLLLFFVIFGSPLMKKYFTYFYLTFFPCLDPMSSVHPLAQTTAQSLISWFPQTLALVEQKP